MYESFINLLENLEKEYESTEWDIPEIEEIQKLKSNSINQKNNLFEQLQKKNEEKKKLKFKFWNSAKCRKINQEITNIKKELKEQFAYVGINKKETIENNYFDNIKLQDLKSKPSTSTYKWNSSKM